VPSVSEQALFRLLDHTIGEHSETRAVACFSNRHRPFESI
jgi:hypothetical protein